MKIHNYLLVFTITFLFLVFSHIVVLYKYFLVLVHHGLYYCQEIAQSLMYQLPGEYGKIPVGILSLTIVLTLLKLFGTIFSVYSFRSSLLKKHLEYGKGFIYLFASLELQKKVVIFSHTKPQAFCFGIRNPKIYISTGLIHLMNENELEIILRHEKYHLEHKDTITLLLASVIESLFPFFPVVSDFIHVYRTDREVAADKAAMTTVSDRQILKNVLKKLIQYEPALHPAFLPAMMNTDTLETRIRSIHSGYTAYKNIGLRNIVCSLISVVVLLGLMVTKTHAVELHEDGQDVIMLCHDSANCTSACGKYALQLLQSTQIQYTPATIDNSNAVY